MSLDCGAQSLVAKFIDQIKRASEATNLVNQVNGIIDGSRIEINPFVVDRIRT